LVLHDALPILQSDFGSVDDQKIKTSKGKQFDHVTSPLNLYACDIDDFNKLMGKLSDYPWISQNIKSMSLIPRLFMDKNLTLMKFASNESLSGVNYLYKVSGLTTNKTNLLGELQDKSYSMKETYEMIRLDPVQDKHL